MAPTPKWRCGRCDDCAKCACVVGLTVRCHFCKRHGNNCVGVPPADGPAPAAPAAAAAPPCSDLITAQEVHDMLGVESTDLPEYLLNRRLTASSSSAVVPDVWNRSVTVGESLCGVVLSKVSRCPEELFAAVARRKMMREGAEWDRREREDENGASYALGAALSRAIRGAAGDDLVRLLSIARDAGSAVTREQMTDLASRAINTHLWSQADKHRVLFGPHGVDLQLKTPLTRIPREVVCDAVYWLVAAGEAQPYGERVLVSDDGCKPYHQPRLQRDAGPEQTWRDFEAFHDGDTPVSKSSFLKILHTVTATEGTSLGALNSAAEYFGRATFRLVDALLDAAVERAPALAELTKATKASARRVQDFLKHEQRHHLVVDSECPSHNPCWLFGDPDGEDAARPACPDLHVDGERLRCAECDQVEVFFSELRQ